MSRTKDQKKSKKDSSRTNHRPAMSNTILGDFGPESDSEGSSLNLSATLNAQHSQGVSTMRSLGGQIAPVSQKAPQISQPAPPQQVVMRELTLQERIQRMKNSNNPRDCSELVFNLRERENVLDSFETFHVEAVRCVAAPHFLKPQDESGNTEEKSEEEILENVSAGNLREMQDFQDPRITPGNPRTLHENDVRNSGNRGKTKKRKEREPVQKTFDSRKDFGTEKVVSQAVNGKAEPICENDPNCEVSKKVRMQYEKLPYPFRDPENDKKFLLMPMLDNLMVVNQRCFHGKKDFHAPFRVLVAGGGTGDASTFLAVQCAWLPDAEVHYVDLSTESMKIAKERLHNQAVRLGQARIGEIVHFHHASLLDVGKMGIGPFDYINCSGVLHHLKDPCEGLAALKSVLKEDGAMSIMVYGQTGRTTIYQIQELMRIINRNEEDMEKKIQNTNLILRNLPGSNLHRRSGRWLSNESNPIEIYDLFLHSQDRAYTIEQLYEWVEDVGLNLETFTAGVSAYLDPELYPKSLSRRIRDRLKNMSEREVRYFSEFMFGHINKYEFYVTPKPGCGVDWEDPELIPSFSIFAKNQNLPQKLRNPGEIISQFQVPNHFETLTITLSSTPFSKFVYTLLDDVSTIRDMESKVIENFPTMERTRIRPEIMSSLKKLVQFDMVHFRHKNGRCDMLNRGHF